MWTWQQASHTMLDPSGTVLDSNGYSGMGAAKNDPDQQCVVDQGPIPRGSYAIGPAINHPRLGPVAIPLTPDPNNDMCQRSGFFIHGDGVSEPGNASNGCIILPRASRETINASNDKTLGVVRGALAAAALEVSRVGALAEAALLKPRPKARGGRPKSPAAKQVRSRPSRPSKSQKKRSASPKKTKKGKKKGMAAESKRRHRSKR
jgi:Protein of unknown function (DUF2778)